MAPDSPFESATEFAGHAVKLMNKKLEAAGHDPLPKNKDHVVEEIDPEDHKKGYVELGFGE